MWCMARLTQTVRERRSGQIEAALDAALGLHRWTWSMAADAMDLDRPQLNRMRTGVESFDLVRLAALPDDIYEDFQGLYITQQRGGGARFFGALLGVLAAGALASRGLAHAVWAAVVESQKAGEVAA